MKPAPFVRARHRDGQISVTGDASCRLGHRLSHNGRDDGIYAEWHFDGQSLCITNCRYGMFPVYYYERDGELWLSSSILQLIASGVPAHLNYDALSVFLRLGFFLGSDTPFRDIFRLPPAVDLRWPQDPIPPMTIPTFETRNVDRSQAIDLYIESFREAVRRRLGGRAVALPLSGGRDSRHILLELCAAGHKPTVCLTTRHFPPMPSEDERVAAMLCEAVDVPHVVLPQRQNRFAAELEKNLLTDFCADEHAWLLPVVHWFDGRFSCVYDGLAGGILSGGACLTQEKLDLLRNGNTSDLAEALLGSEVGLQRLLAPPFYERVSGQRARAILTAELDKHRQATNPVASFYFWNRTRREVGLYSFQMMPTSVTVLCPYLDHDVFDLLMSLPPDYFLDHGFHSEAIHRGHPAFAHIPFENKDLRVSARAHDRRLAAQTAVFRLSCRDHFLRSPYLMFWLSAFAISGDIASWRLDPIHAVYLLQLGRFLRRPGATT